MGPGRPARGTLVSTVPTETSIPRKLEDGWEPTINMKINDFDCDALCDLGASISAMPKSFYNMLDLKSLRRMLFQCSSC